jgi:hypothetical protein
MQLKHLALVAAAAFGLGLAATLAFRLTDEALALVSGILIGWTTGLPAQYGLFLLASRARPGPGSLTAAVVSPAPVAPPFPARTFIEVDGQAGDPQPAIFLG